MREQPDWLKSLPRDCRVTFRCPPANGALWWHAKAANDGPRLLTEASCLGQLKVPRRSFYQVNPALANLLVEAVGTMIGELQPARVVDAFCGVGVFALAAAKAGIPEVCGFDTHSDAIGCARSNAQSLGLESCTFFTAPASQAFERINSAPGTTLILDPPRAGLDAQTLEQICSLEPDHIIYISCAPDTLARDIRTLCETRGYEHVSSRVFDMFARTAAFESLSLLRKG
jgi:tRNA/tmRNA/rRNA uracil-C5-methylase (TrmA/RlmC/RlmD family)